MNTLNKICAALTVVFGVCLAVLVAEIVYVILRGRRLRSRRLEASNGDEESRSSSSLVNQKPSKELFYLFCWKNQTARIEPDAETIEIPPTAPPLPPPPLLPPTVSELDEIMKQHGLYGPSRVLFTIREEEREEIEMDSSSAEKRSRCVSLEEVVSVPVAAVDPAVIEVDDSTPFTTPCGSPTFYTPSPSPRRDKIPPQNDGVSRCRSIS